MNTKPLYEGGRIPAKVLAWIASEAAFIKVIHATEDEAIKKRCTRAAKELRELIAEFMPWQNYPELKPILIRSR